MSPERMPQGGEHQRSRSPDASSVARPGVPMRPEEIFAAPGAHVPVRPQEAHQRLTKRKALPRMTPVFGTAQPPQGLSGLLRRLAYRIPEHLARHWLLLVFADRVDVAEHRLRRGWPVLAAALAGGLALRRWRRA
jgi:hypothetical protein